MNKTINPQPHILYSFSLIITHHFKFSCTKELLGTHQTLAMADLRFRRVARQPPGSNSYYTRSSYSPTLSKFSTSSSTSTLKNSLSPSSLNRGSTILSVESEEETEEKRIIEFTSHKDDKDGVTSPPLWENPRSTSLPLHHHQVQVLSPTYRSQEIARGQLELMEIIKNMGESSYELSLKDLINPNTLTTTEDDENDQDEQVIDDENRRESSSTSSNTKTNSFKSNLEMMKKDKIQVLKRNKSIDSNNNGTFLIKMFLPMSSFGSEKKMNKKKMKKNSSIKKGSAYYAKVSPRPSPPLMEEEKRVSVAGEKKNNGLESINGSTGRSNGRRKVGGLLGGCWSFNTNKTKITTLKRSHY